MTPAQFFQALHTHVDTVIPPHVPVSVGEAPDFKYDEPFHPYVVIWPNPGTTLDDRTVDGRMGSEATDLSFQVTAVAPDVMTLLHVTSDVNAALTDVHIGGHLVRPDVIVNRAVNPLKDESLRPVRYYMATTWQTNLNRSTANA